MDASEVKRSIASLTSKQVSALKQIINESTELNEKIDTTEKNDTTGNIGTTETVDDSTASICNSSTSSESVEGSDLIGRIQNVLGEIVNTSCSIGSKTQNDTNSWINQLKINIGNHLKELITIQSDMSKKFTNSLDAIQSMLDILGRWTSNSNTIPDLFETDISEIVNDRKALKFRGLEHYSIDNMENLNDEADKVLDALKVSVKKQISDICQQINSFYTCLDVIDGYDNSKFLDSIPSKKDIEAFLSGENAGDYSRFRNIDPDLHIKLEEQLKVVNKIKNSRINELRQLESDIKDLQSELIVDEGLDLADYDDDEIITRLGIKSEVIDKYKHSLKKLQILRNERKSQMDTLLKQLEAIWDILRPEDNSIEDILAESKQLSEESLNHIGEIVKKLNDEKTENMAKFIQNSRKRIEGYWNILMYDDSERKKFAPYFCEDKNSFNDDLLEKHTKEIEKLRDEAVKMKPLLKSISELDGLLEDKKQLDESSKDPSRLLRRDSFKILRREEKMRSRLSKLLPSTLEKLKESIGEYEATTGRQFKIKGTPYLDQIREIEKKVIRRSVFYHSPSMRRTRSTLTKRSGKRSSKHASVSRRESNPFLSHHSSRRASPRKQSKKIEHRTPQRSMSLAIRSTPKFGFDNRSLLSYTDGTLSVSNTPIVIKGGSPMRRLDYRTASLKDNVKRQRISSTPKNSPHKFRYPVHDHTQKEADDSANELSDSLIYMSDTETTLQGDKENNPPPAPKLLNVSTHVKQMEPTNIQSR